MPYSCICAQCKKPYQGQRSTSRYCSTRCRTRASRAGTSVNKPSNQVVTALPTPPAPNPGPTIPVEGSTYADTVKQLEAAGRLSTPMGRAALVVASRIDDSRTETGSGLAALVRSLDQAIARATAGAKTAGSTIDQMQDEVAQRRNRRRA